MMKSKNFFQGVAFTFLGMALALSLASRVNAQVTIPQGVPESVHECINDIEPPGLVRSVDIAGITSIEDTDYYYLYAYDQEVPDDPEPASAESPNWVGYPSDLIISSQSDLCEIEHLGTPGDHISLADVVSQAAARNLTLNRFERVIEVDRPREFCYSRGVLGYWRWTVFSVGRGGMGFEPAQYRYS